MHPAPRHITEEELSVLEGCLHRWRKEVENDTRGTNLEFALKYIHTLRMKQHLDNKKQQHLNKKYIYIASPRVPG